MSHVNAAEEGLSMQHGEKMPTDLKGDVQKPLRGWRLAGVLSR
jgi:hypothetical protein